MVEVIISVLGGHDLKLIALLKRVPVNSLVLEFNLNVLGILIVSTDQSKGFFSTYLTRSKQVAILLLLFCQAALYSTF
jgi:hypothetical protein